MNCHVIIIIIIIIILVFVVIVVAVVVVVVVVVKIIRNKTQERVRKKENKVHKLQVKLLIYTP